VGLRQAYLSGLPPDCWKKNGDHEQATYNRLT